jgi:hypothetical protein
MNMIREHLSAWLVAGLLAVVLVAVWGADMKGDAGALACRDVDAADVRIGLPRGEAAWAPDPVLAGLPQPERGMAAYEVAEARSLARHGTGAPVNLARSHETGGSVGTAC